jgi:O-antigen ligase
MQSKVMSISEFIMKHQSNLLNFLILALTGLYVLLIPQPFPLTALINICFYSTVIILIIGIFLSKTTFSFRTPLTLPFGLFFVWATLGLFFTLDFGNTFHDLRSYLFNYIALFLILVNYYNSKRRLETLSLLVILGATSSSLFTVVMYYFVDGFPFSYRLGIGANFKDMPCINIGFITLPALVLAFHRLQNSKTTFSLLFTSLCIFILLTTTFLTQSRGILLGLFSALVILCFQDKKYIAILVAAVAITLSIPGLKDRFSPDLMLKDERNKTNHLAMEVIKEYPISGIGFGMRIYNNSNLLDLNTLNANSPPNLRQSLVIGYPHNTLLDITVRTGVVGFTFYLAILFMAFNLIWKTLIMSKSRYLKTFSISLAACLISYLIPAMFTDTTFGARAVMFYILLSMVVISWNLARNE